jgi:beta-lactamase regulating signal transducer with metallopeptidase domain
MLPIAYYLLKVIICSGILYGYYLLLLRNKVFHKYNRFYLMVSVVLSLLLPLIKINFWQQQTEGQAAVIKVLQAVSSGDEYMDNIIVTAQTNNSFDLENLYPFLYLLVSAILLAVFLHTLYVIAGLLKKYPRQTIDKISFINTDAKSTPFSFFNYIFWNHNIDMESGTGNQIFKHELAHVEEKHTHDKIFINIILIFFWCNPFYWLYRKELNMIHEFIADKKAVEDSDTSAFAAMILQATYPQHRFQLTNNFFYSPIKRRLLMLTKSKNPKVNYVGRVMVLPLLVLIFAAFTIKVKNEDNKIKAEQTLTSFARVNATEDFFLESIYKPAKNTDTVPAGCFVNVKHTDTSYLKSTAYKTKALVIIDGKEIGNVGYNYVEQSNTAYSSIVIYNPTEAHKIYGIKGKYGVITLTQKDAMFFTADSIYYNDKTKLIKLSGSNTTIKGNMENTLICVEGKQITPLELNNINPATISSISILKGEKIGDIIEAKGKTAVINVTLKPANLTEVVVTDYKKLNPLYVIDGEVKEEKFDLNSINPENIERVDVLKDRMSIEKYGEKGKNGVIEIKLKNKELNEVVVQGYKKTTPLYVIDGIIKDKNFDLNAITPDNIDRVDVLKDKAALDKYGEKGKDGMVEITSKNKELREIEIEDIKRPEALYIIDGVIKDASFDFNTIKPNDIEKVDILKGKAATDKYGERAKNGAIEISTKKVVTITGIKLSGESKDVFKVFTKVEVEPSYPGGNDEWRKYLQKNLNPAIPVEEGWKAGTYTVIVQFVVHDDGTVSDVSTTNYQGTKTAKHCADLIKKSAIWIPAVQNGHQVNAYRKQPVTFVIQENSKSITANF